MKKFLNKSLARRPTVGSGSSSSSPEQTDESPEGILVREMTTFCEVSNSPQNPQGNEFVHLPLIVESAESSPAAAKEAAVRIRKYLSTPNQTPNHVQYNAIMLMRILTDNPGHTFTKNFDSKFVTVIKELLRYGRDWHVQHYLRQFLTGLETARSMDEDLQPLLAMWAKEKVKSERNAVNRWPQPNSFNSPMAPMPPPRPQARPPQNQLPDPGELAARIEEAKNSAKLLTQFVQITSPAEVEGNDLIKEFVDRCQTSSRLLQGYINCTNPTPDEDTLLTLIEANDEISVAISGQQRAMLKARKARGSTTPTSSELNSPSPPASTNRPLPSDPPQQRSPDQPSSPLIELPNTVMSGAGGRSNTNGQRANTERYEYNSADFEVQNPFADDYATHESDHERNRAHGASTQGDRVRFQAAEQER
ncbi:hypothetical protein N7532_011739 [Penicillium argentinense]|uniref:GAT domain-containing protein n=1 Tax=Penicillium argentinense TaxID=1131581 RepID=A0A9W9JVA8_9EURO|nr:uncharacterized protein N7532_011739 [Penicillium argentinense]KAJ5082696.1 hypothetical protein N7532_011739 [Penicillium argentinense]